MTIPFVVGAYAGIPADRAGREQFYAALPSWVTGLEIPFRGSLDADPAWLAGQVARFGDSVVTLIPGTMGRIAEDPTFGLASGDVAGRAAALAYVGEALAAIERLHADAGVRVVRWVEVHSAPTDAADAGAFVRSLGELAPALEAAGIGLVIEHCDAAAGVGPGEKRFLSLADELRAAAETGARLTLNWGRSVLETHDPASAREHVAAAAAAGLLAGVMFSGTGPEATAYGTPWADVHLPLSTDEPASLMTPARVAECIAAAGGREEYRGVKIQAPAEASVPERIAMIGRIRAAMVG